MNPTYLRCVIRASTNELDRLEDNFSGLRTILEREEMVAFEKILASHLSVEMRLLHHMMARIFLSRIG